MNITVCIKCDDQGQYSVGEMPEASSMDMSEGEGGGEDMMQPAQDLEDALTMAREMLTAEGQMTPEEQAQSDGYNRAKSRMTPTKPTVEKVFGG